MALRQNSDKEPSIELFIKVSQFHLLLERSKHVKPITPEFTVKGCAVYKST